MKLIKYLFNDVPGSIILGSVIISLAILISSGVIQFRVPFTSGTRSTATSSTPTGSNLKDKLVTLASSQGLDTNKFKQCLDANNSTEIKKDMADAQSAGVSGTPGFIIGKASSEGEVDGVKIAGAYPYAAFKAVLDKYSNGLSTQEILSSEEEIDLGGVTEKLSNVISSGKAGVDDDPVLGNKNAEITIIEFSDYECPFCQRHFKQTYPSIKKDYIDSGKVKLVYRDFIAVPSHDPAATTESVAANCAKAQKGDEAYFKFHDEIFLKTTANGGGI